MTTTTTLPPHTHATVLSGTTEWDHQTVRRGVVWADHPATYCEDCGEQRRMEVTEPPVHLATGVAPDAPLKTWDQRHGCGGWDAPAWVEVDPDDDAAIAAAAAELAAERDQEVQKLRQELRRNLRDQLTTALAMMAEHDGDPHGIAAGSEMEPGVWHNRGRWEVWDWDPAGDGTVTITEHELPGFVGSFASDHDDVSGNVDAYLRGGFGQ